jgi:hypothetical protein
VPPSVPDYEALTTRRLKACSELLETVAAWLDEVAPSPQNPWLMQRQTELIVRAIQSMQGSVLLGGQGLWIPAIPTGTCPLPPSSSRWPPSASSATY